MSTCQDKFFTTFPDFPAMLGYHENQTKGSQWERRRVKDLRVEPLDKNAPPATPPTRAFSVGQKSTALPCQSSSGTSWRIFSTPA